MRINEIGVTRLFGLFNHTIPMNLAERITIIHGPNGFGKTTLLQMVDNLIGGRFSELRRIFFRDFHVSFDSGHILHILRVEAPRIEGQRNIIPANLEITLGMKGKKTEQRTVLPGISWESLGLPLSYVEQTVPYIKRTGGQFVDKRTGEILAIEEIIRTYPHLLQILPSNSLNKVTEPDWLRDFRKQASVRFIEVQRLVKFAKAHSSRGDDETIRHSVVHYSRELAMQIQTKLTEYATLSQSLDRSFPRRLVEQTQSLKGTNPHASLVELTTRLQQLEDTRNSLTAAGLLDKEPENFDLASYLTDQTLTQSVLPVYAADAEQKLTIFNDIAPKLELLKNIINTHFQYKLMSINKEKGFEFATNYPGTGNRPRAILVNHLSSGEQHMIVLLYELLFTVEPNSLIMIDEPEISLHVAWQLQFLSDLKRITELTKIDILIATHAPAIINDRRDLMVELEAPAEAK